ncbi:hypothetical protein C437_15436 [Haloarcula vallismortis ATCC 29715]|uniref:Uncharacterized protein n=1 Tax=Haloarcula vallismortis ATCC 29715 TaxID=662477 RepID=M0J259_HALVA|nr:hypothetical protein [Haloarcula vallismortis]EMA01825.1 hypothetical protein C437_15436 [Haloarcula vallismortis ATCC 29715]
MSVLLDLLSQLGVGGQVMVAGSLVMAAYYLLKGKKYAGMAAAVGGSMVVYGVVVLVALAVAIGLGWLDPNPELMHDALDGVLGPASEMLRDGASATLKAIAEAL